VEEYHTTSIPGFRCEEDQLPLDHDSSIRLIPQYTAQDCLLQAQLHRNRHEQASIQNPAFQGYRKSYRNSIKLKRVHQLIIRELFVYKKEKEEEEEDRPALIIRRKKTVRGNPQPTEESGRRRIGRGRGEREKPNQQRQSLNSRKSINQSINPRKPFNPTRKKLQQTPHHPNLIENIR
jgi:hypothetical protein